MDRKTASDFDQELLNLFDPTLFTGPAENDWRAANLGVESRC